MSETSINPSTHDALDMHRILCERIRAEKSQAAFARKLGVTPAYVSYVMSGERPIGDKLLRALGYRRVVRFEPIWAGGR